MNQKSEENSNQSNRLAGITNEDELLDALPRTPYTDGWPEDKWREEFDKHPFFMTKSPDPSEELSPLVEGLQQLKYSETENTPDELAKTYKDDGNFYFKCKKYRDAITNYTAGLQQNCSDELKAQLFNNKAASNYFLENYKSSLIDCEETLKLNPNHSKAKIRKAKCLFYLEKYDQCIETCDAINLEEINADIMKLKKNSIQKKKLKDRNNRKDVKKEELQSAEDNLVLQFIKDRKIKIKLLGNKKLIRLSDLDPFPDLPEKLKRVHIDRGRLFWPVLYNFPELTLNMPISEFDENATFYDGLRLISKGMMKFDPDEKFVPNNIRIFHLDKDEKLVEFEINSSLSNIMSSSRFVLSAGIVLFILLLKDSEFTKEYLRRTESSFLLQ